MRQLRPHIDEILSTFFQGQLEGKSGLRRRRIEGAQDRLRACLESDGERVLIDSDCTLLAAEREFHPTDAFVRTMHADDLICALNSFVSDKWMPADHVDRRVQLRIADALAGFIVGRRLVDAQDMMCFLLELRSGIDTSLRALKQLA